MHVLLCFLSVSSFFRLWHLQLLSYQSVDCSAVLAYRSAVMYVLGVFLYPTDCGLARWSWVRSIRRRPVTLWWSYILLMVVSSYWIRFLSPTSWASPHEFSLHYSLSTPLEPLTSDLIRSLFSFLCPTALELQMSFIPRLLFFVHFLVLSLFSFSFCLFVYSLFGFSGSSSLSVSDSANRKLFLFFVVSSLVLTPVLPGVAPTLTGSSSRFNVELADEASVLSNTNSAVLIHRLLRVYLE